MNYIVSDDSIREDSSLTHVVLLAVSDGVIKLIDSQIVEKHSMWIKRGELTETAVQNQSIGPFTALNLVREEAS